MKCTKRIKEAKESDINHLSISFLAMAIKASTAYGPKKRQEQLLIDYTNAVIARGIPPNDYDDRLGSAVSMAAYFGYANLLKLLLDAGCVIVDDREAPHALRAAIKNTKHECIRVLIAERRDELRAQLHKESLASWRAPKPTTLKEAIFQGDIEAVRMLRDLNTKALILFKNNNKRKWTTILRKLYPEKSTNVYAWSKQLHWSFAGADRRMLNWLWYTLKKQKETDVTANRPTLPSEVWLLVFGFIGRGSWSLSTLADQNGLEEISPSLMN